MFASLELNDFWEDFLAWLPFLMLFQFLGWWMTCG